jgi:hypothetical protein
LSCLALIKNLSGKIWAQKALLNHFWSQKPNKAKKWLNLQAPYRTPCLLSPISLNVLEGKLGPF